MKDEESEEEREEAAEQLERWRGPASPRIRVKDKQIDHRTRLVARIIMAVIGLGLVIWVFVPFGWEGLLRSGFHMVATVGGAALIISALLPWEGCVVRTIIAFSGAGLAIVGGILYAFGTSFLGGSTELVIQGRVVMAIGATLFIGALLPWGRIFNL